jgi:putative DNA primase/helicase
MRNDTLNKEAFSLGTLVGAGMLGIEDVRNHLTEAALACGLERRETDSTIERALRDGIAHPREMSDV